MKTFLESVADDIIKKYGYDLSRIAVVFPNKRASLFLNSILAEKAERPIWSPAYITISDLYRQHSKLAVGDQLKLICDLHKSFVECTGINESLDHFYGWGQVLLADFDDIDKHLADAGKVFANLRDLHELDDVSYLTKEQVAVIRSFFSNFSEEHNSELKKRFLNLWSHFFDIYEAFNRRIEAEGLAYEGALYRKVVADETVVFEHDKYLFVGFNVLQKVEQRLFSRLLKDGKAAFYWDFDRYYINKGGIYGTESARLATGSARLDTVNGRFVNTGTPLGSRNGLFDNEAGHYLSAYLDAFPNELDNSSDIYDSFSRQKDITYIASPTETAQAHHISTWLRGQDRIAAGRHTAIVLCNEKLLKTVVRCLPDETGAVNITTGYPLGLSPTSTLVAALFNLRITGYIPHSDRYRLKAVRSVLANPYMVYLSDSCAELLKQITTPPMYYIPAGRLCIDERTSMLFNTTVKDDGQSPSERMTDWVAGIVKAIAVGAGKANASDPLLQESLFRMFLIMNRLKSLISSGDLCVDVPTLQRLVNQIIQSTSVPFHGEPAEGVQIMGVLETRNLDFDHVLLLSCNEGDMPKGVNDSSFIPYNIRKAYELTTVDNKVSIYSYYFHRLLQRASDITIMYNNSTSDGKTGEMSRFMQQILVESGHDVKMRKLLAGQELDPSAPKAIGKDGKVTDLLLSRFDLERNRDRSDDPLLTPTAINKYMRCQLLFFYRYVCGLKEQDDPDEDKMQNRLFGNIFHEAAEAIYRNIMGEGRRIGREAVESVLKDGAVIERAVDDAFAKELFKHEKQGRRRPEYNGLQLISREVVVAYLRRLLEVDAALAPFDILGLETCVAREMAVTAGTHRFTTTIGGRIDRIDRINDGSERIRVVDYKTGSKPQSSIKSVENIFSTDGLKNHSDYYLQTFLYARLVSGSTSANPQGLPVSPALLFIRNASAKDYDPTLCLDKEPVRDITTVGADFDGMLAEKVAEMFNPDIPFSPTDNTDLCLTCPYLGICRLYST